MKWNDDSLRDVKFFDTSHEATRFIEKEEVLDGVPLPPADDEVDMSFFEEGGEGFSDLLF